MFSRALSFSRTPPESPVYVSGFRIDSFRPSALLRRAGREIFGLRLNMKFPRSNIYFAVGKIISADGSACPKRLCAAAVSVLLGRIGRCSRREIARSALWLARSAQVESDNAFSCM
ncbi:hypothetical protein EVAR_75755_1 [Eumeta japonica]|uniref:Uncharacterized protein n=1 Tax=Eumeta variegata TaxID=151549 RepID=A0A4C1TCR2_EUMVA|nr:hypothetical protein EVAR_75755_1 [Eumeta japonica]